ncbi:hypothetical protein CEXT_621131 [Caerostris extrusa]|uniref:Ycf15 n=1 Tax=Caerostris extrusa TaxID=172846 RepID=A0AAV4XY58_CAEEX|nr:hypothetical protein CEXT_621131 [Caerostris extrusa]
MSQESVSKGPLEGRGPVTKSRLIKRHRWNEEPFPFILFLPNPAILLTRGNQSNMHQLASFVLWLTHDDKCWRTRNFLVDRSCHVILT